MTSTGPSSRTSSRLPTIGLTAAGRLERPRAARCGAAIVGCNDGSWWRIARSVSRRAGARLDPQLFGEHHPRPTEGGQGVGRSTRLVERAHQQRPRFFPVRVGLHQRLEAADALGAAPATQLCIGSLFDDRGAQLGQSLQLASRNGGLGHLRVGFSAERRTSVATASHG
jgi:hypothetical protein